MNDSEIKLHGDSIFWIEVEKIRPNPFQPRKEFDERALNSLAESIRQYGVLQPLVVTRKEIEKPEGGIAVAYELIAGERRLRASKLAGLSQVPAIIREGDATDKMKLELAIIENLQREDLNPIDRAEAFRQLCDTFGYKAHEVATKIGMSREYVSNSIRILNLPSYILDSLRKREISEGHTRPLLMLIDRPDEQEVLFKDIVARRLTVRESERAARHVATDRVRKSSLIDPELAEAEETLAQKFGTKVEIQKRLEGGKIILDYFSADDLKVLLAKLIQEQIRTVMPEVAPQAINPAFIDDRNEKDKENDESDLYSVSNFSL
ncbi:MAG TPA: ParB/RepB/Spo0J family partition protein [Candidatus Paceibacterota bacterium]